LCIPQGAVERVLSKGSAERGGMTNRLQTRVLEQDVFFSEVSTVTMKNSQGQQQNHPPHPTHAKQTSLSFSSFVVVNTHLCLHTIYSRKNDAAVQLLGALPCKRSVLSPSSFACLVSYEGPPPLDYCRRPHPLLCVGVLSSPECFCARRMIFNSLIHPNTHERRFFSLPLKSIIRRCVTIK
jgi:hypothetical protein